MTAAANERTYLKFITAHGRPRTAARRYEPVPPISADGITDCWTHAWDHAAAFGLTYVEGLCEKRPGVLATHAWCESTNPFGSIIVEVTEGFEHATKYVGLAIDTDPAALPATLTADWGPQRSSILQAAIGGGFPASALLALTKDHR